MKVLDPLHVPLTGRVLIEASAGTGKTYTITTLVLRSVLEQGISIDQALVVTFTNAATEELKARVRERLNDALAACETKARGASIADPTLARLFAERRDPEADRQRLQAAVRAFDESGIFTIHGFCQRVLEEHALSSGLRFDLELSADVEVLLRELVEDFWQSALADGSEAQASHASARLDVSALMRLAWQVLGAADVTLAPAPPAAIDPGPPVDRYVAARSRARAAWRTAREEVFELLADNPALKHNQCRPEKLAQWCDKMDAVLGETRAVLGQAKQIEFFTRAGVRKITKKNSTPPEHAFFEVCDELAGAHRAGEQALDAWLLGLKHEFLGSVSSELALRKQRRGLLSFDDLLKELRAALRAPGGRELAALIRARYPVALIDEFQDTDPAQYEIFSRIYSDAGTLILIGDPKQAIYGFRGADVFTYLKAAEDTGDRAWTLGTNYRSDPKLIHAVNALFSRVSAPFVVEQIGFSRVEARPDARDRADLGAPGPFEIVFLPRDRFGSEKSITKTALERELPRLVAADVVDQLERWRRERSGLGAGDVAVLTRTNRQAHAVQAALSELGVPTALGGDASVLDSPEANDLARVMAALCEPASTRRVRAAVATDLFGVTAEELVRLDGDEAEFEAWLQNFSDWHATWKERGFMQAFRRMLRERDLEARVLRLADGERRLTNLLHLSELVQKVDGSWHPGMLGATRWFDEVRADRSAREGMTADAQQIRLERDAFAVQLTTVHRSKGLEYPVVYCPYLWSSTKFQRTASRELRYHDPNDGKLVLDLEPDPEGEAFDQADREALSEGLRLAYVALTRAKHRAVVYWGAVNGCESSALGYLLHQGDEHADPRQRAAGSRLHGATDADLLSDLERLARDAEGAIELRRAERGPASRFEPEAVCARALRAREFERRLDRSWRSSSFSALAASSSQPATPALELGRDRDATSERSERASEASRRPGGTEGRTKTERPFAAEAALAARVVLDAFPRGARPGEMLHAVLERLDFETRDASELEALVASELARAGLGVAKWSDSVVAALGQVLDTPLGPPELSLRGVSRARRWSELEFTLPVQHAARARDGQLLNAARLAGLFARRARAPVPKDYAARLGRLGFAPLQGYLRGFIDLVFEHAGRYFIVDYKSNHLGPAPADYASERLGDAMAEHHYFLQYHLYAVALHRLLGVRLGDYDYDRHFGGVLYLFLRGMAPDHAAGTGVFFDRPPRALVEDLSELLGGGAP